MDPLEDVFAALRVKHAVHARIEADGPWGISFACGETARFGLVLDGRVWLRAEGVEPPRLLQAGDCYVLVQGRHYVLSDELGRATRSCLEVVKSRIGGVVEIGSGGARATVITGWFTFDEPGARPLMELMPALLVTHLDMDRTRALAAMLGLLEMETAGGGLGSAGVVSRLADILLMQAIRAHAQAGEEEGSAGGWLGALTERRIGAALRALHREPARDWTLEQLANMAGMSRSAFASRFRQKVGESPLAYLARWRLLRAATLLRQGDRTQGEIAALIGYESEAAFSKAFKRAMGVAPGAWRRGEAAVDLEALGRGASRAAASQAPQPEPALA
jgi:AraC-like DNA-binding protein